MKTISVVIPTYNEEKNVLPAYFAVKNIFEKDLANYNYEILFIDNYSTDATRFQIANICKTDQNVKAIFNAKNFGFSRSTYYGLTHATGDCVVLLFADLQDPPSLIVQFVTEWEAGKKIVIGIKNKSRENKIMYFFRSCYYKLIKKIADVEQIEHFTGFGLYDSSFINTLSKLGDSMPYLRGIVAEMGPQRSAVFYEQQARKYGKSHFGFFKLYDVAMLGITSYSKVVMRLATIGGFILSGISLLIALVTVFLKLINVVSYPTGTAAILVGVYLLGSVQLFFIGFLGEYVMSINTRVMHRPLVIEECRLNFEKNEGNSAIIKETISSEG